MSKRSLGSLVGTIGLILSGGVACHDQPAGRHEQPTVDTGSDRVSVQGHPAAATGTLQGDVYYLTRGGDIKKGAGLAVKLFEDPDSVLAALNQNCDAFSRARAPLEKESDQILNTPYSSGDTATQDEEKYQRRHQRFLQLSAKIDSLANAMMARADGLLARPVRQVNAGIDAHFRFDSVAAGRYLLVARWPVEPGVGRGSEHVLQWALPVDVAAGGSVVRDLSTDQETRMKLYCGWM